MPEPATGGAAADPSRAAPALLNMAGRISADARRPDVASTHCTEVRWFVPGGGPPLDGGSVRSCIDSYRGEMLAERVSVKSRAGHGAGVFAKLRSDVLAPIAIGELRGIPETWARWELDPLPPTVTDVHVHKDIARRKGAASRAHGCVLAVLGLALA